MGRRIGISLTVDTSNSFLDDYSQELFACHAMIDSLKITPDNTVTVTINKEFLVKVLYSHIRTIRKL